MKTTAEIIKAAQDAYNAGKLVKEYKMKFDPEFESWEDWEEDDEGGYIHTGGDNDFEVSFANMWKSEFSEKYYAPEILYRDDANGVEIVFAEACDKEGNLWELLFVWTGQDFYKCYPEEGEGRSYTAHYFELVNVKLLESADGEQK